MELQTKTDRQTEQQTITNRWNQTRNRRAVGISDENRQTDNNKGEKTDRIGCIHRETASAIDEERQTDCVGDDR